MGTTSSNFYLWYLSPGCFAATLSRWERDYFVKYLSVPNFQTQYTITLWPACRRDLSGENKIALKRTHNCGELTKSNAGGTVVQKGWVNVRRDHGQLVFIDLRDREGITQIVFDATNAPVHDLAKSLRSEYVIEVEGRVRERAEGL